MAEKWYHDEPPRQPAPAEWNDAEDSGGLGLFFYLFCIGLPGLAAFAVILFVLATGGL